VEGGRRCISFYFIFLKEGAKGSRWEGKWCISFSFYIFEGRDRLESVRGGRRCNVYVFCIEGRGRWEPVGRKVEPYSLV